MTRRAEKMRLAWRGLPRRRAELASSLRLLGDLRDLGWQLSVRAGSPIDQDGGPLPWMNYGAISVLDSIVRRSTRVFEYGSGYSTVWLNQRSDCVHGVEHDPAWHERLKRMDTGGHGFAVRCIPCGGDSLDAPPDDPYVNAPGDVDGPHGFDLIIVDGLARRTCLQVVDRYLRPGGVVVLDDAERMAVQGARRMMQEEKGFRELAITGPKPAFGHLVTTTFYLPLGLL